MELLWLPCYLNIQCVLDVSDIWLHQIPYFFFFFFSSYFHPKLCFDTPPPAHLSFRCCPPDPDYAQIVAAIDEPSQYFPLHASFLCLCSVCDVLCLVWLPLIDANYSAHFPDGSCILFPFPYCECFVH